MQRVTPPRHIIWSTDALDLDGPFQRRHYIRQVLTHGRMEDIGKLDLSEVERLLDELALPPNLHSLWERFFKERGVAEG